MLSDSNTKELQARVLQLLKRAKDAEVLVLGAGLTGRSVSKLLSDAGYKVCVLDQRVVSGALRDELESMGARIWDAFAADENAFEQLQKSEFAFAVLSPGVSLDGPLASLVSRAGVPKISEIDLGIAYLGMPTVAVTGTNGKTTVVTLIDEMLRRSSINSLLTGNVGKPMVGFVDPRLLSSPGSQEQDFVLVTEVSSYQLEAAYDFVPRIGVWLNIDSDHLERHRNIDEYLRIKSRIFTGQSADTDWALICADDPSALKMKKLSKGRFFPFGVHGSQWKGAAEANSCFAEGREIVFCLDGQKERYWLEKWHLIGEHNVINLAGSIAASRLAGATQEAIQSVIDDFVTLEHRLEVVTEREGVLYVNDSKATNVAAAKAAIEAVSAVKKRAGIVLLLGGQLKEGDWEPLKEAMHGRVRDVVLFGQQRAEIQSLLGLEAGSGSSESSHWAVRAASVHSVERLEDAVRTACDIAGRGDVVLFSPACASFDAYASFEQRGEHFCELVKGVLKNSPEGVAELV